jgi:hypothetical protein
MRSGYRYAHHYGTKIFEAGKGRWTELDLIRLNIDRFIQILGEAVGIHDAAMTTISCK